MAQAALDFKADDVVVLDLRKLSYAFDFFVLCNVSSDRRIHALGDKLQEGFAAQGIRLGHLEGRPEGGWVLLDYGSVVAHLFSPEMREFYNLDRLWADAPRLSIPTILGQSEPSKKEKHRATALRKRSR